MIERCSKWVRLGSSAHADLLRLGWIQARQIDRRAIQLGLIEMRPPGD